MDKKVKLSIDTSPVILSRPHYSFPLCVIQGKCKNILPLVLCNYIDVEYDPSALWNYCFFLKNPWLPDDNLFDSNSYNFSVDSLHLRSFDILEKVRLMLSKDYYVRGDFNTSFVKSKRSFGEFHYNSEYLIYGYDDDEMIFTALGRTADEYFCSFNLSYDEYMSAVQNRSDKKYNLNFIKFNNSLSTEAPVEKILKSLKNYYNSTPLDTDNAIGKQYGVQCMQQYSAYVRKIGEVYDHTDMRYIRFFSEHTYILSVVIHLLAESGVIPNGSNELTLFDNLYKASLESTALLENYNITHKCSNVLAADKLVRDIIKQEVNGIKPILDIAKIYV